MVNDLASEGLIHSVLAPISSVELAQMYGQNPSQVVFVFLLVPLDKKDSIKKSYEKLSFEEGGIPQAEEDLSQSLLPGEFLAEVRIHSGEFLQEIIDMYLAILPKGTKLVHSREVVDLINTCHAYELKFYNRLMTDIKSVELEYYHRMVQVGGKIEQYDLTLGIIYFDAENKELFRRH